ncbi:hypothetical protein [Blastococcus saxobsidens]|uniref:Uncharacterized protein n=1 Tax=Blastococcus saxobsidens TaxID=138336 RepID=A0A4Q7Y1Z4_9ACTN|nr:hypothetical protein [Blastococcus saxobsidens]RZU30812.1 hypothetical protein BKA19_0440 [Blastococcus saxobsidens]
MDVIARLRAWALARPRVLLVDPPAKVMLRWSVEAELDRRGWRSAASPADADLLVVLGEPGPELAAAVDVLWSQIPEPRHRLDLHHERALAVDLDAGLDALVRRSAGVVSGADRPSPASLLGTGADADDEDADGEGMDHEGMDHEGMDHEGMDHEGMDHEGMDHEGMDHEGMDHEGMDHEGMDHEGMDHEGMDHEGMDHEGMDHEGMDHEGMHMHHSGEVAGLPMASTASDRDGLELDVLKVALGPVLPGWPTGLVLRADLQGDVLTSAELAWLDADLLPAARPHPDPQQAALDRLARFLDVAGWSTAARDARRARDGLAADGSDQREAQRQAEAVARRVHRSRTLSWTAGGIGQAPSERSSGAGVLDRVRRWCDAASGRPVEDPPAASLDDIAALVEGVEIGSARLIVASLDLSPVPVVPASEHAHA